MFLIFVTKIAYGNIFCIFVIFGAKKGRLLEAHFFCVLLGGKKFLLGKFLRLIYLILYLLPPLCERAGRSVVAVVVPINEHADIRLADP